ncbi:MAG: ribose-phosphate pyrophosphokinase [Gammaproteobacteria bacterium]|nr:ribose-phosphate pyrophosphokinase [Gammaproteobacteria bacterium]
MSSILFALPENQLFAKSLVDQLKIPLGDVIFRHFPDGDSYVRIKSEIKDKEVFLLASLNQPDPKVIPLLFFSKTAKTLGAKKIHLIAPYLAYMRQDKAFNPGEAINSRIFATLLSQYFDTLITIDPHLHRYKTLDEIYTIPTYVLHADILIAEWIQQNIKKPVLIGPDVESKQWVLRAANHIKAPYLIFKKTRIGDRDVQISVPHIEDYQHNTAVLIDDIISSAATMIEAVKHLKQLGVRKIVCIGIHAIFAGNAYQELKATGVERIITCNTILHESSTIDVSGMVADAIRADMLL